MPSIPILDSLLPRTTRWLLGDDHKQRLRQQRSLLASCVCLVAIATIAYGIRSGLVPLAPGQWLIAYLTSGLGVFYVILRSGLNLRARDPGLTLPQMAFAVTGMTAAYAVSGPIRGGFLMLLACAMAFAAFLPKPTHVRNACLLSMALLGAAMGVMSWIEPARYPANIEAIHFLLCAVTLPTIAAVAGQLSGVRTRLRARNDELADALVRIHKLATRDELTGMANRRQMQECLETEVLRIKRSQRAACLCLIDLDGFKQVNDRYGHPAGDVVLREFARVATSMVRHSDVIARWGGEEFLWLLPDTSVADAHVAIERLHRAFAGAPAWAQRPELQTTFSAGLAQLHSHEDLSEALERTDTALYAAKSQGRNKTIFTEKSSTIPAQVRPQPGT